MSARVGTYAWATAGGGRLTRAERARLLADSGVMYAGAVGSYLQLVRGRRAPASQHIDATTFTAPDSRLAREAEAACAELSEGMVGHSHRTWIFGRALAALDGADLDPELFYCAALVHDWGMTSVVPGQDFTIRGADRAHACGTVVGLPDADLATLRDAVTMHANPRIDAEAYPLAAYLSAGALVDGGLRMSDLSPATVAHAESTHPRLPGFGAELAGLVRTESLANPGGRFALYRRCGFGLAVRGAAVAFHAQR